MRFHSNRSRTEVEVIIGAERDGEMGRGETEGRDKERRGGVTLRSKSSPRTARPAAGAPTRPPDVTLRYITEHYITALTSPNRSSNVRSSGSPAPSIPRPDSTTEHGGGVFRSARATCVRGATGPHARAPARGGTAWRRRAGERRLSSWFTFTLHYSARWQE